MCMNVCTYSKYVGNVSGKTWPTHLPQRWMFSVSSFVLQHNFRVMRAALKVMPPILLCWPKMSEEDVGGMEVEVEPSILYPITVVAMWQITAEGQSDSWCGSSYDTKVCHWVPPCRKNTPIDIRRCLLDVSMEINGALLLEQPVLNNVNELI